MGEEEDPERGNFEYLVSIWSRLFFFQRLTSNDLKIKQMFSAETKYSLEKVRNDVWGGNEGQFCSPT